MKTLAVAVLAVAVPAIAAAPELPKKFENRPAGISLRYPRGWSATTRPLTQLVSPTQVAAVASFPLWQRHPDTNCTPRRALAKVGSRGAFIFVMEYKVARARDFPQRPRRFVIPRKRVGAECFPGTYVVLFQQRHRYFQVHIAIGRNASRQTRELVVGVLDTLVIRAPARS